jgi:hypothetical protein
MSDLQVILKSFESPDEVREFVRGRFELVRIGGRVIGRATYEPGWKWSEDVGPQLGLARCSVEYVGLALEGTAVAAMADGNVIEAVGRGVLHREWIGDRQAATVLGVERWRVLRTSGRSLLRYRMPARTAESPRRYTLPLRS